MKQTVNNLMIEWQREAAHAYSEWGGAGYGELDTSGTERVRKELEKLVGGNFQLPDNDWYFGLFAMIHTAQELKRKSHEANYLWRIIENYIPEDQLDLFELERLIVDDYADKYEEDN